MDEVRAVLAVLVLGAWVGLWWLAVRIMLGTGLGFSACWAVAVLAFGVPLIASDIIAVCFRASELPFLIVWGAGAVVTDGVWVARRVRRWYRARRQPRRTGRGTGPQ